MLSVRMREALLLVAVVGFAALTVEIFAPAKSAHGPAPVIVPQVQPQPAPAPAPQPLPVQPKIGPRGEQNFGYEPKPLETRRFLKTLPKPRLRQAAPQLFQHGDDPSAVLLYRALYEAYSHFTGGQQWVVGAQGIGDCVSWGWGGSADTAFAVMWKLGETSEWRPAATEAIYGGSRVEARGVSRGGWSDGSYGGAAAKWVRDWGLVFRQAYPDLGIDLSIYSSRTAKDWGNYGCGGQNDNGRLDAIAKKHPVRHVALVTSFAEAAAAIRSGYPVPVCSGRGFSSRRDEQGFCRPSGSWSHCMAFIGVRSDRPGLLCLNSWGPNWVSGPKWPEDQPEGSFWVDAKVADAMLAGEDSFALSGVEGFPYRDLTHGDWVQTEPAKVRAISQRVLLDSLPRVVRRAETDFSLAP